jgi:hypothetical protein
MPSLLLPPPGCLNARNPHPHLPLRGGTPVDFEKHSKNFLGFPGFGRSQNQQLTVLTGVRITHEILTGDENEKAFVLNGLPFASHIFSSLPPSLEGGE